MKMNNSEIYMERNNNSITVMAIIATVILIGLSYWTYLDYSNYKTNLEYTQELAEISIKKIEQDGYMTLTTKLNMMNNLNGKFEEFTVEGPEQQVTSGEDVVVIITVTNPKVLGSGTEKKTKVISVTGKAK